MFTFEKHGFKNWSTGGDSSQQHRVVSLKVAERVDLKCFYHTHTHTRARTHTYNPYDMMDVVNNFTEVIILQVIRTLTCHIHFQLNLVTQSCLTLCDPMDCRTPGFPVLHHLLELAQTHVHRGGNAIQPSHPLSSPSPACNLSQHQRLFQ